MYTSDLVDIPFEVFGGYCPAIPPANLAPEAAAMAQDFIYPQAALRTRGGLQNFFSVGSPIPNNWMEVHPVSSIEGNPLTNAASPPAGSLRTATERFLVGKRTRQFPDQVLS